MFQGIRTFILAFICLALVGAWFALYIPALPVWAQDEEPGEEELQVPELQPAFTQAGPFDNLAVVLVIDVSGSMSYTDPLRLREPASGMFIDLLGADDYLGIIIFDNDAELIRPLGPVGTPAEKESIMEELAPRLDPRGDTDFVDALELARRQFSETETGDRVPVIMLLTDGEPDPYPGALRDEEFMAGYMELLWEQVELLAEEEILVYNVAFSDEIDPEVIRRISTETRGLYYILPEPTELLVAFYQSLEALKDRRSFIRESVDLGVDGSHSFSFEVQEYIRQVNLVVVGEPGVGEEDFEVTIRPPRGRAENIEQLIIGGRDNYTSIILSRPGEEHFGSWEVEVSGSGEVVILGNADLYLEALLIDPDPNANYPLDEPMEIQVEVITRERYADAIFHLELEVTAPGQDEPVSVPMFREGNSFRGIFESVNQQGRYRLNWDLLIDENIVFSDEAVIEVQQLPAISTDFYFSEEGFRLGEEMVVSASLVMGGERVQQGPHLQVERFSLDLEYRDGARLEMDLFDSGSAEHGNSRVNDGIWSNRLHFGREGSAVAMLTAEGEFRGSNFVLKRSYSFSVSEAGSIAVTLMPEELWTQAGRAVAVPLQFRSSSPFTQTVRVSTPNEDVELLQDRVVVRPGSDEVVKLQSLVGEENEPGSIYISMAFEAEDGMAQVRPEVLDFEVEILTAMEAFQRRYAGLGMGIMLTVGSLLAALVVLIGGGSLLYRFYLLPRMKISGNLFFSADRGSSAPGSGAEQQLDLGLPRKTAVVLSFDPDNRSADFLIANKDYSYDMIVSNSWNDNLPRFLRGWAALFKRKLEVVTNFRCTPPGVLVTEGKVLTSKELHSDDQFETGGLTFRYCLASDKGAATKGRGVNLLDGKM